MMQTFFKNQLRSFYSKIPTDCEDLAEFKHFKQTQRRFQRRDNLPVFLKGGKVDKILFGATIGLTVIGFIHTMRFLYSMSYPTKAAPSSAKNETT